MLQILCIFLPLPKHNVLQIFLYMSTMILGMYKSYQLLLCFQFQDLHFHYMQYGLSLASMGPHKFGLKVETKSHESTVVNVNYTPFHNTQITLITFRHAILWTKTFRVKFLEIVTITIWASFRIYCACTICLSCGTVKNGKRTTMKLLLYRKYC